MRCLSLRAHYNNWLCCLFNCPDGSIHLLQLQLLSKRLCLKGGLCEQLHLQQVVVHWLQNSHLYVTVMRTAGCFWSRDPWGCGGPSAVTRAVSVCLSTLTCSGNDSPWRTGYCWTPYEPGLTSPAWRGTERKDEALNMHKQHSYTFVWN